MPLPWTTWRRLFVLLLLGAAGCGLGKYEEKMDEQRKRVVEFDALNQSLDAPIEMPTTQTGKGEKTETQPAWPFDVYLRLPRGYGTAMKDKSVHSKTFPMARYAGGDVGLGVFVVAALVQEGKKGDEPSKFLYKPESFRAQLRLALSEYTFRAYKIDVSFPEKSRFDLRTVPLFTAYPDADAPTISFDTLQYANIGAVRVSIPYTLELYVRHEETKQIAIVFQRAAKLPDADAFRKTVDAVLGTLDMSAEVASKRAAFRKAR